MFGSMDDEVDTEQEDNNELMIYDDWTVLVIENTQLIWNTSLFACTQVVGETGLISLVIFLSGFVTEHGIPLSIRKILLVLQESTNQGCTNKV